MEDTEKKYSLEEFELFEEKLDLHCFEYVEGIIVDKTNAKAVPSQIVDQVLNPDFDEEQLNYEFAMSSKNHLILSREMTAYLVDHFKKNDLGLTFYAEGACLKIKGIKKLRKPDMMVVKESEEIMDHKKGILENPLMIIEFGSPSTSGVDHDEKLTEYFSLESVQEYVLISSQKVFVRQFNRYSNKKLICTSYDSLQEILTFESFDFAISLSELYKKCVF